MFLSRPYPDGRWPFRLVIGFGIRSASCSTPPVGTARWVGTRGGVPRLHNRWLNPGRQARGRDVHERSAGRGAGPVRSVRRRRHRARTGVGGLEMNRHPDAIPSRDRYHRPCSGAWCRASATLVALPRTGSRRCHDPSDSPPNRSRSLQDHADRDAGTSHPATTGGRGAHAGTQGSVKKLAGGSPPDRRAQCRTSERSTGQPAQDVKVSRIEGLSETGDGTRSDAHFASGPPGKKRRRHRNPKRTSRGALVESRRGDLKSAINLKSNWARVAGARESGALADAALLMGATGSGKSGWQRCHELLCKRHDDVRMILMDRAGRTRGLHGLPHLLGGHHGAERPGRPQRAPTSGGAVRRWPGVLCNIRASMRPESTRDGPTCDHIDELAIADARGKAVGIPSYGSPRRRARRDPQWCRPPSGQRQRVTE